MDPEGCHYYDNRRELEGLFGQTFGQEARNASEFDLKPIQAFRSVG
jgi:hypothetical protein